MKKKSVTTGKFDFSLFAKREGNYFSTKRFGPISTGHRQWRDDGHCAFVHGYGRYVVLTFGCRYLDDKMWVQDFGGLKDIRKWIESEWDHRLLIASDDPLLPEFQKLHKKGGCNLNVMDVTKGYGPGIEASCKYIFDHVDAKLEIESHSRVWVEKVEIFEHENNSAIYERPK
jgi:6-pyruvoyltetrahydropterin/6-carboxytetrahydropterin synthase